jgi:hypothetical protein
MVSRNTGIIRETQTMELSKKVVEALLDLIEIKLSCIQVLDRDDAREVKLLQQARGELCALAGIKPSGEVIPMHALTEASRRPRARAI